MNRKSINKTAITSSFLLNNKKCIIIMIQLLVLHTELIVLCFNVFKRVLRIKMS